MHVGDGNRRRTSGKNRKKGKRTRRQRTSVGLQLDVSPSSSKPQWSAKWDSNWFCGLMRAFPPIAKSNSIETHPPTSNRLAKVPNYRWDTHSVCTASSQRRVFLVLTYRLSTLRFSELKPSCGGQNVALDNARVDFFSPVMQGWLDKFWYGIFGMMLIAFESSESSGFLSC